MAETQADIIVRGGLVYDGTDGDPVRSDVAIRDGLIVAVEPACPLFGAEEIDATGRIVTPGFIDVHTHYDGQAIWSDRLNPSSSHGVTTVVMGNCGVGFAPCRPADRDMLVRVMEGVEDIPEIVMATGLPWDWETFPEFLARLDQRRHDIDMLAYIPHSALRVYAMGVRGANREPATEADLAMMADLVQEAIECGALGFSTSGVPIHRTRDGEHIPSFGATERELHAIAAGARRAGHGVLQILVDLSEEPARKMRMLADLSKASGLLVTFTLAQRNSEPRAYRDVLAMLDALNAEPGVRVKAQVFPRPIGMIMNHDLTMNPFRLCPSYAAIADLPIDEKLAQLRTPAIRQALLSETPNDAGQPLFLISRAFPCIYELGDPPNYEQPPERSIAGRAAALGVAPEELAYDLLLENGGRTLLLAAIGNYPDGNLDATFEMLRHPHCVPGLGDGGAHYGLICDSSYPTFTLTHWTRDRAGERWDLGEAIAALSHRSAQLAGLSDRGRIAVGLRADINVIDYAGLQLHAPTVHRDLPGGGRRLSQAATGYAATIVGGVVIARNDTPSGALPGRLVRGPALAPV
ncbi:N-acyl-D-amino-acid deacylase family protein [Rhizorhabdus wittichii]